MKKIKIRKIYALLLLFALLATSIFPYENVYAAESVSSDVKSDGSKYYAKLQNVIGSKGIDLAIGEYRTTNYEPYIIYHYSEDGEVTKEFPEGSILQMYAINTTNNDSYYDINVKNVSCENLSYMIFNNFGVAIDEENGGAGNVGISKSVSSTIKLNRNSTYYIVLYTNNGESLELPSKSIINVKEIIDEEGDSFSNSKSIELDKSYNLKIDGYNDVDYLKFNTKNSPAFYNLYCNSNIINSSKCIIYDSNKEKVDEFEMQYNTGKYTMMYLKENSTYYLEFSSENTPNENTGYGNYNIKIDVIDDDYSGNSIFSKDIKYNTTYQGKIDAAQDVDFVKFNSNNNTTFVLHMINYSTVNNIKIELYDFNGQEVFSNDVFPGFNGDIIIKDNLQKNATYFMSFSSEGVASYNFNLSQMKYNINYVLNGGINNSENPNQFIAGTSIVLKSPTREGYNFVEWYIINEDGEEQKIKDTSSLLGNTTIYAKWNKAKYSINYVLNGGINNSSNPKTYDIDTKFTLKNPTREGYTFSGWYTNTNYTGNKITNTSALKGNVSLYAKWTKSTYNISYILNKGTNNSSNPKTYDIDTKFTLKNPTRKGYSFSGWYTNSKYTGSKITNTSVLKGNVSLYAKWTKTQSSKTSFSKLKSNKSSISVKIKSVKGVSGYEIRYSTSSKMSKPKTVKLSSNKVSTSIKKLKSKKNYYVQVRTYKIDSTGAKVYSSWSKTKSIKTK